jgi:hypothetical protein
MDPLGSGTIQRLQPGNDVSIPANDRIDLLETKLKCLIEFLVLEGFDLPEDLINDI